MCVILSFPESILEKKSDCILPGWDYIRHSSSHLLLLGWLYFFTDVQQSKKIFPGKMVLKKKAQFPCLELHSSCKYISHTSFQSPRSLYFFPYHTGSFSPETDLGATGPVNGFRAILGVTHFLSSSVVWWGQAGTS